MVNYLQVRCQCIYLTKLHVNQSLNASPKNENRLTYDTSVENMNSAPVT